MVADRGVTYTIDVTAAAKKLLKDALSLPAEERVELIEALSDSLHLEPVELGPAWTEEIASRIAQLESGEVTPVSWEDVEARIRSRLDRE